MDHKAYLEDLKSRPIPKELPFAPEEYDRRISRVRMEMEQEGQGALLVTFPSNLYYLTGYYTFSVGYFSCLILPSRGDPAMLVSSIEISAALLSGWVEEVGSFAYHDTDQITAQLARMLKDKGLQDKRIGLELRLAGLTPDLQHKLQRAVPTAELRDASDIVFRARLIKSPQELDYMRRAARITSAGIVASLDAVRPGITDNDVAKVGYEVMVGAGSEFPSTQPIVTSGYRSGWMHTTYKRVPLKVGDNVMLEYGGCYQRYTAPMIRTAVIGEPSKEVRRVAEAVKDVVARLLEAARPGRTGHEIAREAHKGYAHIEAEVFFTGVFGYTIGAGYPPSWAENITFIAEGVDRPLEPGMTFHLPITLRSPGRFAVGLGETIAITQGPPEVLTEKERDIHIVPA